MLQAILPLLEAIGGDGGASTSLGGRHSGIGSMLGRLIGTSETRPFESQQELGGAFAQISTLVSSIKSAKDSLEQLRGTHSQLEDKQQETERNFGFRDPQVSEQMAGLQRQQIENARQMQLQQQTLEGLQSRAAVSMDPTLHAQEQRRVQFARAGALEVGGQLGIQGASSMARWAYQPIGEAASFVGGPAGNIANQAVGQVGGAISNIASTATHGASMGMAVGGPMGAAVGAAAGAVAQTGIEIAKLPSRIQEWSESLLASQKQISRFSGVMAQAFAQREVRGLNRDIASAATTGASTADLSKNLEDLYDTLRPLKDSITIVISRELTSLVRVLNAMSPVLAALAGATAAIADMATGGVFDFKMELVKALGEVMAQEIARERNKSALGAGAAAAFSRLQGEDPKKPRQAPRR